jgi:hypothetical protein
MNSQVKVRTFVFVLVQTNVGKNPDSKNPDSRNPDSRNPDSRNPDIWQVGKNPDKTYFLIKNRSLGKLEK